MFPVSFGIYSDFVLMEIKYTGQQNMIISSLLSALSGMGLAISELECTAQLNTPNAQGHAYWFFPSHSPCC